MAREGDGQGGGVKPWIDGVPAASGPHTASRAEAGIAGKAAIVGHAVDMLDRIARIEIAETKPDKGIRAPFRHRVRIAEVIAETDRIIGRLDVGRPRNHRRRPWKQGIAATSGGACRAL